jgi:Fic family protein
MGDGSKWKVSDEYKTFIQEQAKTNAVYASGSFKQYLNRTTGEIISSIESAPHTAGKNQLRYSGKVCVLTGPNTFSSANMLSNATQQFNEPLTEERLFGWQASLFPTGRSGMHKIVVGAWRDNLPNDPMQVVSGAAGKEKVHFEAPAAELLPDEMKHFIQWFNNTTSIDVVVKAAIAHLWFVTIHPFDDGNGRIARAIADMQLARADGTAQRFYSMSAQIRKERNAYYTILEQTQQGSLDITDWLEWFLQCISRALLASDEILSTVLQKANFWKNNATTIFNKRQVLLLNKLLDGFDGKLTSSKWAKITKSSQDTALRDIQDLVEKKVLIKEEAGGRSSSYILIL